MKWFKHYENAQTNNFIQALLSEKNGLELYAQYFLLLEFLCRDFKKDTTTFIVSNDQLKTALRVRQDSKLKKVLEVFEEFSNVFDAGLFEFSEVSSKFPASFSQVSREFPASFQQVSSKTSGLSKKFWEIKTPIILELIGKDFKRTRSGRGNATAKKKETEEEEELETEKGPAKNPVPRIDYNFYSNCWNILAGEKLPQVKTLSDPRKRVLKSHIGKNKNFHDEFEDFVKKVLDSDFLCGVTTSFVASFDWCLKPANYIKIIEDNYKNKTANANNSIDNLELN